MMHRPSVPELLKPGQSYYSLVVAVAKRARDIAQQADDKHEILLEKPVQLAVEDFAKGRYKLIESDEIGVIRDRRLNYVPTTSLEDDE